MAGQVTAASQPATRPRPSLGWVFLSEHGCCSEDKCTVCHPRNPRQKRHNDVWSPGKGARTCIQTYLRTRPYTGTCRPACRPRQPTHGSGSFAACPAAANAAATDPLMRPYHVSPTARLPSSALPQPGSRSFLPSVPPQHAGGRRRSPSSTAAEGIPARPAPGAAGDAPPGVCGPTGLLVRGPGWAEPAACACAYRRLTCAR